MNHGLSGPGPSEANSAKSRKGVTTKKSTNKNTAAYSHDRVMDLRCSPLSWRRRMLIPRSTVLAA